MASWFHNSKRDKKRRPKPAARRPKTHQFESLESRIAMTTNVGEAESNNTFGSSQRLSGSGAFEVSGAISSLSDVDFYSFVAPAGTSIEINCRATDLTGERHTEFDPVIGLFSPSGTLVTSNDDGGDGSVWAAASRSTSTDDGIWRVAVTHYNDFVFDGTNNRPSYDPNVSGSGPGLHTGSYKLSISFGQPDLTVSVDAGAVAPALAKDLNLKFFVGGERIIVPVTANNTGRGPAIGMARLEFYLSRTRELASADAPIRSRDIDLSLGPGQVKEFDSTMTVPKTLEAGKNYYLIVKVVAPGTNPGSIDESNLDNNVAVASGAFRFLGTATHNSKVFTDANLGFKIICDTLKNQSPIPANVNTNDYASFIAYFEGNKEYPYLDLADKRIPTIGVGFNLQTINGTLKQAVADAVRYFYQKEHHQALSANDTDVINMLIAQARTGSKAKALYRAHSERIFQDALEEYQTKAMNELGPTWASLNLRQKVAVVDLVYNLGSLREFPSMVAALRAGDYLLAGFHLLDAKRTTQAPGLTTRTNAEFQNLLLANRSLLGKIIVAPSE